MILSADHGGEPDHGGQTDNEMHVPVFLRGERLQTEKIEFSGIANSIFTPVQLQIPTLV